MSKKKAKKARKADGATVIRDCTFDVVRFDGQVLGILEELVEAVQSNARALNENAMAAVEIARVFRTGGYSCDALIRVEGQEHVTLQNVTMSGAIPMGGKP